MLHEKVKKVVSALLQNKFCYPVSVGGSVRDTVIKYGDIDPDGANLLNTLETSKDADLELFRITPAEVEDLMKKAGIEIELVGRSFPVYKVKGSNIDLSFPRQERKTGILHTSFEITTNPDMTFREACLRRDFTINAMGFDWRNGVLIDPCCGKLDITNNQLVMVSEAFKEDALRVLRAFKFVARLGYSVDDYTMEACDSIVPELKHYARERVLPEWQDFILNCKAEHVFKAFDFLVGSSLIDLYPELRSIIGVPQHPDHHPEGSVWIHTMHCFKYFCANVRSTLPNDAERLIVGLAVLTHDLGKATTTEEIDGKITAYGHEDTPHCRQFLERLFDPADERITVIEKLVKAHMRPVMLYKSKDSVGNKAIRKLNLDVGGRVDLLLKLVECDKGGRPPKPVSLDCIEWVKAKNTELGVKLDTVIKPIIRGRHLVKYLGMLPGPGFKPILDQLFEDQLEGQFLDEESGKAYLARKYDVVPA